MADQLVSQPDHGDNIIEVLENGGVASPRLQLFFDDITRIISDLTASTGGTIVPSDFQPSSIIYRPSIGTDILPAVINEKEFIGRPLGGEIQGLSFVESWAILGNGTTNITINDTGGANDFTVESNTSSKMLVVQGGNNRVSIGRDGLSGTDGTVHIINKGAGVVAAAVDGNTLVLEDEFEGGMSILNGANSTGNLYFGAPSYGEKAGHIFFFHDTDTNLPRLGFNVREKEHLTLIDTQGALFNRDQDTEIDFQVNTLGSAPFLFIDSSANRIGISNASVLPTDGVLHIIKDGVAGVVTADVTADLLVLEGDGVAGAVGMTILCKDDDQGRIFFGDVADPTKGLFQYNHNGNAGFQFYLNNVTLFMLSMSEGAGFNWNPAQNSALDFNVQSFGSTSLFHVDANQAAAGGRVGISQNSFLPDLGVLHIKNGDSGFTGTAPPSFDDIVFEGDTLCGFSFFAGNQHYAGMSWGDRFGIGDRDFQASFVVKPDWDGFGNGRMEWRIDDGAATRLYLTDDTGFEVNPLNNLYSTDFRVHGFQNIDNVLHVATGAGQEWVSMSNSGNDGTNTGGMLQLIQNGKSGITPHANADILTLDMNIDGGLSLMGPNGFTSGIYFATVSNNDAGRILFNNTLQRMTFHANGINWLDIGASFIININQDDRDFVIRSVNSQQLIRTDALNDRVSIADVNVPGTDGLLHLIQGALAGTITASVTADALVLEGVGPTGLSMLVDNATGVGNIAFGDPTGGNLAGVIGWTASTGVLDFAATNFHFTTLAAVTVAVDDTVVIQDTSDSGFLKTVTTQSIADLAGLDYTALIALVAAPDAPWVFNESAGDFDWRLESTGSTHMMFMDAGNDAVGISDSSYAPQFGSTGTVLEVNSGGTPGTRAPLASGNNLVISDAGFSLGMTIIGPNSNTGFINFGDQGNAAAGGIRYSHGGNDMVFWVNTNVDTLFIDTQGVVINENSLAGVDFRAESNNHTHKLYLDSGLDSLQVGAGTGNTSRADIGGALNIDNSTQASTAIGTEETLLSYSLIASSLTTNGRGVRITAWGTTAANATLKQIRLKFGATHVFDSGNLGANGETWHFVAEVYRTGAATQDAIGFLSIYDVGSATIVPALISNPAETLSGAITIAVTSTVSSGAAASDVVAEGFTVEFI